MRAAAAGNFELAALGLATEDMEDGAQGQRWWFAVSVFGSTDGECEGLIDQPQSPGTANLHSQFAGPEMPALGFRV